MLRMREASDNYNVYNDLQELLSERDEMEVSAREDAAPEAYVMLALHRTSPELLRICFRCFRPFGSRRIPIRLRPLFLKIFQPMDAAVLRDNAAFECCFESARRAWRGSAEGVMLDAQVYAEPWGFKLEDVDVPVRLWHGKQDRAFSFRIAEEVAQQLPNCKARCVDGVGHFSLPIRHIREILADLVSASS